MRGRTGGIRLARPPAESNLGAFMTVLNDYTLADMLVRKGDFSPLLQSQTPAREGN